LGIVLEEAKLFTDNINTHPWW